VDGNICPALDCGKAQYLICQTKIPMANFLGLGARFYLYGRCLTKAFMTGRVAVMDMSQPGVAHVHGRIITSVLARYMPCFPGVRHHLSGHT